MGIETVSLIISVFVEASLGVAALMRNYRSRLCVSFAALAGMLFLHDALAILEGFDSAVGWFASPKVHALVTLLLGPLLLILLGELVPSYRATIRRFLWLSSPVFVLALMWLRLPLYPRTAIFGTILCHLFILVPATMWLVTLHRASVAARLTREKIRLRFAFWGGLCLMGFFLTDAASFADLSVPPLGTLARVLYLMLIYQTFVQRQLMTAEEVVTKISLFGGIALMLSMIFVLLVAWVGDRRDLFVFNTLIASFVIIVLFDPIRNLTTWLTRKFLLRKNLMLEEELQALGQDLMGVLEPIDLARKMDGALRRALGIDHCALFVIDRDGLSYLRIDSQSNASPCPSEVSSSSSLIDYMTLRRGRPFVAETIEGDRDSFRNTQPQRFCQACIDTMRQWQADFIIPFMEEGKLLGFCAVKTGERIALSNEQLRLFMPIARQASVLLKSAHTFNVLRDRDKLAAVGEMAAGLAHEIKNPLGAIKGAAQLLREGSEGSAGDRAEFLKIILDETDRLSGVLTDFLDYAKPRKNYPQTACNPIKVIEHTASLCLHDKKVLFEVQSDKSEILIEVDPELLKQVLLNLFLNAVQAMERETESPKLSVRVRELKPRKLLSFPGPVPFSKIWGEGWDSTRPLQPSPFVEIQVRDNGRGISEEEMSRIFTPFFTTKPKGTGLGLAICQRLVEGMGGTIHAKANHPTGSIFTIHLPVRREEREMTVGLSSEKGRDLSV